MIKYLILTKRDFVKKSIIPKILYDHNINNDKLPITSSTTELTKYNYDNKVEIFYFDPLTKEPNVEYILSNNKFEKIYICIDDYTLTFVKRHLKNLYLNYPGKIVVNYLMHRHKTVKDWIIYFRKVEAIMGKEKLLTIDRIY